MYPAVLADSVGSDNPSGAGNQQERLSSLPEFTMLRDVPDSIGWYLAGFVDGEGSFNVSFRVRDDYEVPWKVSLCFNVSQREYAVLTLLRQHLGCGTMRQRRDRVWYFEVNNFRSIQENVIPFFERVGFLSAKKQRDFAEFKDLAALIQSGRHLTSEGIRDVVQIRKERNDGGKRRHTDGEILARLLENPQRPYAGPPQGG